MQPNRRTATESLTAQQQAFLRNDAPTQPLSTLDPHGAKTPSAAAAVLRQTTSATRRRSCLAAPLRESIRTVVPTQEARSATHSVTLRLRQPIARALRQASIERSLDYRHPYTQQAIAETALALWLRKNGHPIDE